MGGFTVGAGYARYRGPATDSAMHAHAAFQIAIAVRGDVALVDADGVEHRAAALVVPPMVRHRMLAAPRLHTWFIEPQSTFACDLRRRYGQGIAPAEDLPAPRRPDLGPSAVLDPRLLAALEFLRHGTRTMPEVAAAVGLSPQRLRALARDQLGLPLPRWRVWAGLARAAEALRAGQALAEAAATAGFTDQAHLTRRMREMIGLTPAAVLPALRSQPHRPVTPPAELPAPRDQPRRPLPPAAELPAPRDQPRRPT
nr:hypothetical protein GCM10020063_034990 [Dactylosporangium thailandense]